MTLDSYVLENLDIAWYASKFNSTVSFQLHLVFMDTTPEEILSKIRSLNYRKRSGNDNIPANILKLNEVIPSTIFLMNAGKEIYFLVF